MQQAGSTNIASSLPHGALDSIRGDLEVLGTSAWFSDVYNKDQLHICEQYGCLYVHLCLTLSPSLSLSISLSLSLLSFSLPFPSEVLDSGAIAIIDAGHAIFEQHGTLHADVYAAACTYHVCLLNEP